MSCFYTYSGIKFDILNIEENKIDIRDIAHSLSLLCRGNGHYKYFYSVAQHCINCYEEAKSRKLSYKLQLSCLLHDSAEAYLSDIISDIKEICPDYIYLENKLINTILKKYKLCLTQSDWAIVYDIDKYILMCEFQIIQGQSIGEIKGKIKNCFDFYSHDSITIEKWFLKIFYALRKIIILDK